jgi:hypothetical protein
MVHQGETNELAVSVNVAVARSHVAWYGPENWLAGVTHTVAPSVGRKAGSGFQGEELIVCGLAACALWPAAAAAAGPWMEGLGRTAACRALSCV